LSKKEIDPLTEKWMGQKKYEQFVDVNSGKTKKLELHVIPTQIDRTDVLKVLQIVTNILSFIDKAENHRLGLINNYVRFKGRHVTFMKVVATVIPKKQI